MSRFFTSSSLAMPALLRMFALFGLLLLVTGCSRVPERLAPAAAPEREALAFALARLGPDVSAADARKASDIAFDHSRRLLQQQGGVDPPVVLGKRLHLGIKTPGFCHLWADDLLTRLRGARLGSLDFSLAMSPARTIRPVEHSAVVATSPGQDLLSGIVLDPCRREGRLHWAPADDDFGMRWHSREAVLWEKRFGRKPWYASDPLEAILQEAPEF